MKKASAIFLVILFLLFSSSLTLFAQAAALDYHLFITPDKEQTEKLSVHTLGIQGYLPSQEGQRLGWAAHLSFPITPPSEPFWGGFDLALLLGQEFFMGPAMLAGNLKIGGGISYSNLGQIAVSHFSGQLRGEIEFGLKLSDFFIISSLWGAGAYVNMLPGWPGDEYLFWQIFAGLRFIWLAQEETSAP
ncbi:MAG: hypothetical protein JXR70_09565 [Spirochaetales bacterium]|nr:hypothetical protein [Spirochaetales bacterium]